MRHELQWEPFFWNFKLYLKSDPSNKIRMQKMLIDWYFETEDLRDDHLDDALVRILLEDLHDTWLPVEEYEICALYKDAIKNCRDILIGIL